MNDGADAKRDAMPVLVYNLARTFFRLRAIGQREGVVTSWGGGTWGLLHGLIEDGAKTVPEIARQRPVSRQHVQRLADEAAAEGLVEFIDNPEHKRSRLVQITDHGRREHERLRDRIATVGLVLAEDISMEDIETTIRTLASLREKAE